MARRAAPARAARRGGRRALRRGARAARRRRAATTTSTRRSSAGSTTTRARCSSSSPSASARRRRSAAAGATTGWSSSSAARRRPASAGRRGSSGSCSRPARTERARAPTVFVALPGAGARPASARARGCASAGFRAEIEQAGRSLKGQLKQADRLGARAIVILGETHRGEGHGDAASSARPTAWSRPSRWSRGDRDVKPPRPNALPQRTGRASCAPARWASELRVAGWVHRRRDHGGLIFIDLRDRTRPAPARLPPGGGARGARRGRRLRGEDVISVSGELVRRDESAVNPDLPTGEVELVAAELDAARRRRDPAVPDRRGRPGGRGAAPSLSLPRPAQGADARQHDPPPRRGEGDPRLPLRRGLPGGRDADHDALDSRGRARLPRAEPPLARLVVRAPAVAPALQAAADDRAATSATSRSRAASATRTSAPTASPSSPSSTWSWPSSRRRTSSR